MFILKREKEYVLCLIFILIFIFPLISGDTQTSLEIPNAPPFLLKDIPNQSWTENESKLNAFDLDDYFEDPEAGVLTYYNSSLDEIYIEIDPLTNQVSFHPLSNFKGTKNVTFYASDGVFDTLSNIVMLYVGMDFSPPNWSSPNISHSPVYQNDILEFLMNWTDDRALAYYIFSINQGAGWENYSYDNFTGTNNISRKSIQIRAPPLNTVYWRYYAYDTSGNMNASSIQSFPIASQPTESSGGSPSSDGPDSISDIISRILSKIEIQKRKSENFQLSASEFKVSLKQGSSKTKVLRITNTGLEQIFIGITSRKISPFIILSETNISIMPGKSKEVTIDFIAKENTIPGQYFGYIDVKSNKVNKSIPTVIDVQAIDIDFDLKLNVSEKFLLIKPGKSIKFNITLSSLKDLKEINATLYYAIKDYEGKVYNFSEEEISFFYNLLLERELEIPEIAEEGHYLIYARATDDKNIAIDSFSFDVGTRFNFSSFFKIGSISFLSLLIAILFSILMVKYKRDKKKERLLELYMMLNKMKVFLKDGKEEEALKLFIKIKKIYHEPVSKEILNDKDKLQKEITNMYNSFNKKEEKKAEPIKEADKVLKSKELKETNELKEPRELKTSQKTKEKEETKIENNSQKEAKTK